MVCDAAGALQVTSVSATCGCLYCNLLLVSLASHSVCIANQASATLKSVHWLKRALSTHSISIGKVEDLGSGEYKAYVTATAAGSYTVSASLNGVNIAGGPFAAEVTAVEVEAACSYATGDGVVGARSGCLVSKLSSLPVAAQTGV